MVTKIDFRVHAGAPSSRNDDERSRSLALAYLDHTRWVAVHGTSADVADRPQDGVAQDTTSILMADQAEPVAAYDETTYLDDTQLAYNALESQLLTSSLDVREERTPNRSTHILAAESPWPNDLAHHSPVAETRTSANDAPREQPSSPPQRSDAEARRPPSRGAKIVGFKPFKLPIKRKPVADVDESRASKQSMHIDRTRMKTPSINDESQSSYLRTPFLVTPIPTKIHSAHDSVELGRSPVQNHDRVSTSDSTDNGSQKAAARSSAMLDYREHTPKQQFIMPYVPLREGGQVGVAVVGNLGAAGKSTPSHMPQRSQASGSGEETTSELPTSYSLSDITSESSRARLRNSQRSTSDPGPLGAADAASQSARSARSASQPERQTTACPPNVATARPGQDAAHKQECNDPTRSAAKQAPASNAFSAIADRTNRTPAEPQQVEKARQSNKTEARFAHAAIASILQNLPITIQPPEPETAVANLDTHVTASLRYLADFPAMANGYRPVCVRRDLRSMERGYWLVPALDWSLEQQQHFWQYMTKFIGNGQAGWGVWALREPSPSSMASTALGCVKVYCWGEVVKHIYLMLYVASGSKIRKLGLQWLDSEETIVVQMRGPATNG